MGQRVSNGPPGAAAAAYLAALLHGPARSGAVLAVRSGAALASIATGPSARLIAIAIADSAVGATRTAHTVLLSGALRPALGTGIRVGAGVLHLAGREYRVTRYWPSGLRAAPVDPAALADLTDVGSPGLPAHTVRPLRSALASGSGLAAAARSLVGLGAGSTPAGDDVLAGVALGLRVAARGSLLQTLGAAISPDLADRTTGLSADLLRAALAGHASPEVLALVRTLGPAASPTDRRRAVAAVLALGHTSGADLLLGLTTALRDGPPSPACGPHPEHSSQPRRTAAR